MRGARNLPFLGNSSAMSKPQSLTSSSGAPVSVGEKSTLKHAVEQCRVLSEGASYLNLT